MEVILLERIGKLGQMGDVVRVKDGYARNFLLPNGKALRATKDNKTKYEGMKGELQQKNQEAKGEADKVASKLNGKTLTVIRQASEVGQLYGSVTTRDIAALLSTDELTISRTQVYLNAPIKNIGHYDVPVALHPEVEVKVGVNVARNEEEAERLARGENVTVRRMEGDDEAERRAAKAEAETFFEEGAEDEAAEEAEENEGGQSADASDDDADEKPAKKSKAKKAKVEDDAEA